MIGGSGLGVTGGFPMIGGSGLGVTGGLGITGGRKIIGGNGLGVFAVGSSHAMLHMLPLGTHSAFPQAQLQPSSSGPQMCGPH